MAFKPPTFKEFLYTGYCTISSTSVLMTGGSITYTGSPGLFEMAATPQNQTRSIKVAQSDGTKGIVGTISFDVTTGLPWSSWMKRGVDVNIKFADGTNSVTLSKCRVSSVTVQGSVNAIATGSLSFVAMDLPSYSPMGGSGRNRFSGELLPYWQIRASANGMSNSQIVQSWAVRWDCSTSIVYGNENTTKGVYIKQGSENAVAELTTNESILSEGSADYAMMIGNVRIQGSIIDENFNVAGVGGIGWYRYSIHSVAFGANNDGSAIN